MEDRESGRRRAPRYEGEDTSPTTEREIRGFYAYGLAAEVFAVCGVGSFLPVTLEQLARENGVLWSDGTTSCMAKVAERALGTRADHDPSQCMIKPFGIPMTTSSFAMYTFSVAVLLQALTLVSFSSFADHGNYRKRLLVIFGLTGATAAMLFMLVFPSIYLLGPLLVVIGVTCLGSSFVLLNSFLPLLVLNHPQAQRQTNGSESATSIALSPFHDSENGEQNDIPATPRIKSKPDSADLQLSSRISSKGVGIGYAAAVGVQVLSILILFGMSKTSVPSTIPLRMVLFVTGAWWFGFTILSSMYLKSRPGPPLETGIKHSNWLRSYLAHSSFAWLSLWRTIKVAFQLRQVVIFLVAWFLLSDAVATVSGTAILFARTELKMGTVEIALLSITATSSGIAGAYTWPIISRRWNLHVNRTIVSCIFLMEIIPLYGLLGYVPFIQSWGVGGLQKSWEIFPLAFIHGFVMGGLNSYCRSFFSLLIPPGSEAAFYALYAITDKGSSAVGPAIVGRIIDVTGHIRPAFIFLTVLIALPGPLIWMVDVERGQEDAVRLAKVMKGIGGVGDEVDGRVGGGEAEAEGLMEDHD